MQPMKVDIDSSIGIISAYYEDLAIKVPPHKCRLEISTVPNLNPMGSQVLYTQDSKVDVSVSREGIKLKVCNLEAIHSLEP